MMHVSCVFIKKNMLIVRIWRSTFNKKKQSGTYHFYHLDILSETQWYILHEIPRTEKVKPVNNWCFWRSLYFFPDEIYKKKKTEFLNQLSRGNSYSQCIFAWIDLRTYFQKKCVASRQVAVYFFYYSNLDYSV